MNGDESVKYLGIDWGEKRIGLSLADGETKLATPFKTVGSLRDLLAIIKEEDIDIVVVGKPIKMRGETDGLNPSFNKFLEALSEELSEKTIELYDERLTSKAADALPGGKIKAGRDEIAAMLLLQDYLDRRD